jgi:hypothetical protein
MSKKHEPWRHIEKSSTTWAEIQAFAEERLAMARACLDDPTQSVVNIRVAQGETRALKRLLALADKPATREVATEPEDYPTGGDD